MASRLADDDAVSPVIGVILMVAITVVLAGVAFILFAKLRGDEAGKAPSVALAADDADDEAQVVRADVGLDWFEDVELSGSCTPLLNGAAFPVAAGTPVRAGDVLTCESGEDLRLTTTPAQGNALLFEASFD